MNTKNNESYSDCDYYINTIEIMDYDTRLSNLYTNRALLVFTHGKDWFIGQANRNFPKTESHHPGLDPSIKAYLDSQDFYRHCWETENGYDRTEDL